MIILIVVSFGVIECDMYRVYRDYWDWHYLYENMHAPSYHGVSGYPPRDIKANYLTIGAQRYLNATNPNDWTTANGLWRFETATGYRSDLCLTPDVVSTTGAETNKMMLEECGVESQFMYGSDHYLYEGSQQLKLSQKPGYWTIDSLITGVSKIHEWRDLEGFCMAAGEQTDYALVLDFCTGGTREQVRLSYTS